MGEITFEYRKFHPSLRLEKTKEDLVQLQICNFRRRKMGGSVGLESPIFSVK